MGRKAASSLAASIAHITEQARGRLDFDFSQLEPLVGGLRSGVRYPGSTYGLYADIVLAILSGDSARAESLLTDLTRERPAARPLRVLGIGDPAHAPHRDRYLRQMCGDPVSTFEMLPATDMQQRTFVARFARARALIAKALPEFSGEFDELVSDVIMVAGDESAPYQFDGGSSYMLWGTMFLNVASHSSDVAMVEVLAHEGAHVLLYALTLDEALVENSDDELFPSPLRHDPRPMDGIYHATFVSARMHWAMSRLIGSGLLDAAGCAEASRACDEDVENFWSGYDVVRSHGRLTSTGKAVMQSALCYMESCAVEGPGLDGST